MRDVSRCWVLVMAAFLASVVTSAQVHAQDGTSSEGFDISGMWTALILEDWFHRLPGAALGDYTGIPMNDAARQKANSWDASVLSQPERQAQPHPAQYSFREGAVSRGDLGEFNITSLLLETARQIDERSEAA